MSPIDRPPIAVARAAVVLSYALLLMVLTIETLWLPTCGRSPNTVVWLLNMLPLLILLPAIWRRSPRGHIWLCFVLMGYFLLAVTAMFGCGSLLVSIELTLIILLFISAMMYARWRARDRAEGER